MPKLLGWVVALVYVMVLLDLTLIRFPQTEPSMNLVPMRTIALCWSAGGRDLMVNVGGNLAAFVPVGVLVPWLRERRTTMGQVALMGLALSLAIEALQFDSGRRTADVDDLLLNAAGAILGYLTLATWRWLGASIVGRNAAGNATLGQWPVGPSS